MTQTLILILGVCAVGLGGIFARYGLDAGTSALTLAVWRLTIAAALLGAWRLNRRDSGARFGRADHVRLAFAGLALALHFLTWLTSLQYISVARSTLLVSTTPVWAGLLGFFVPSMRPSKWFWFGLAASSVGVWLVTTQGGTTLQHPYAKPEWIGDLTAGLGAICLLPYLLLSQRVQQQFGTEATVRWIYGWAAVCLWIIALPTGQAVMPLNTTGWMAAGGMAVLPQLVGHTIFNWSMRHFSAGQVSAATLLEPVFAGAFAWGLFGERLTIWQGLGAGVLLFGVSLALRKEQGFSGGDAAAPESKNSNEPT